MGVPARKMHLTPEEYLRREMEAECRSEYWDGVIVAMAGSKKAHERISGSLYRHLGNHLDGTECEAFTSGQSVHIPAYNRYVYPDVSIACDAQFTGIAGLDVLTNPVLVVEVLSKSTADIDLTAKRDGYGSLPSLKTYVVVSQEVPRVELFTPLSDGSWRSEVVAGLDASVSLPAIGCTLALADIYRRVDFASEEDDASPKS